MIASPAPPAPAGARRIARLFHPVDLSSLVVFRIAFGLLLALHFAAQLGGASSYLRYVAPPMMRLSYPGLDWVRPPSPEGMRVLILLMIVAGLGIMAGFLYRLCCLVYGLLGLWIHFMDPAVYMNHYYLVALVALLCAFVPAHGRLSLDALLWRRVRRTTTPFWTLALLRFEFALPFVFGGIAKLNPDWLRGRPANFFWNYFVTREESFRWIGAEPMAILISAGGLAADLLAVPLLLWPRTRLLGFGLSAFFHMLNAALFSGPPRTVGLFPWFMIAATTLYFDPDWPLRLARAVRRLPARLRALSPLPPPPLAPSPAAFASPLTGPQRLTLAALAVAALVQVAVPLRANLYPGYRLWTEEGMTHAWTMMCSVQESRLAFEITDPATGERWRHDPATLLKGRRLRTVSFRPQLIWQYARRLERDLRAQGRADVEIRADSWVALNGRKPQRLIDPRVDLTSVRPRWGHYPWVLPLEEPLPSLKEARNQGLARWAGRNVPS